MEAGAWEETYVLGYMETFYNWWDPHIPNIIYISSALCS